MGHSVHRRVLTLEFIHKRAADERTLLNHTSNRLVDLRLDCEVLGVKVNKWNLHDLGNGFGIS